MARHVFNPMQFILSRRHITAVRRNAAKSKRRHGGRMRDEGERFASRGLHRKHTLRKRYRRH